jgi:oligopeptide/dipeptide ABC transporter ATP-binding protein
MSPSFIILDEPTSALDVSVQAQILNLLKKLKKELNLSFLFISHNLIVVRHMSDRLAVMYAGEIVEEGATEDVFTHALHPYTQALISSVPIPDPKTKRERIILQGEVPNLISPPSGCRFHPRCQYAFEICGWTSGEVLEPFLSVIASGRYSVFKNVKTVASHSIKDSKSFEVILNAQLNPQDSALVKEAMKREAAVANVRALNGIKEVEIRSSGSDIAIVSVELCDSLVPKLQAMKDGHRVSCHLYNENSKA